MYVYSIRKCVYNSWSQINLLFCIKLMKCKFFQNFGVGLFEILK